MSLLDAEVIRRLHIEFCRSMEHLLLALCRDIEQHYATLSRRLELPTDYFRFLAHRLEPAAYSNWKVVGWIEALNDLVYFLDLLAQIHHERDPSGFAEQLFSECEHNFFENSYLDELFPLGRAQSRGLAERLRALCARLAFDIRQESIWLDPQGPFDWIKRQRGRSWAVPGRLNSSFERAEAAFTIPIGIDGSALLAPASLRRTTRDPARRLRFVITNDEIALHGQRRDTLCTQKDGVIQWHWRRQEAVAAPATSPPLTIGPTLHYGKDREPKSLSPTNDKQVTRISRAWKAIERAWPEGHVLLMLLTTRVVPLDAPGVVSFSYRHRPGLSFINCFERDNLDLIDDLVHENSHHHLNLLLRKHLLHRGDRNEQIFYSPWRRSLRPLRGILHATFTFTMAALLFERLSTWAETRRGKAQWRKAGLTSRDLVRARFRGLEEIESVRYSLLDLNYARRLKWITIKGACLAAELEDAVAKAERQLAFHREAVLASSFGPALRRHVAELRQARRTYGPMKSDQV